MSSKFTGWCAITLAFATWNALPVLAGEDALTKAAKESNGTFRLVSRVTDGQPSPEKDLKGLQLVLNDGKWTITRDGEFVGSGTYKVVALKDGVRQVEATVDKGQNANTSTKQISKQEGKKLTVCKALESGDFPREYVSKPGSGHTLEVWVREKP